MRIDFISDLTCPWCAIGLHALEQAIARLGGEVAVELHLQAFELNPDIGPAGEPIADYARRKYGSTPEQVAERQRLIRQRGAEAGVELASRTHVYNTFDAHRLLHWAGLQGQGLQRELKHVLLDAYHRRTENLASHEVLVRCAADAGLDAEAARQMLLRGEHAAEVRAVIQRWRQMGIDSVPSVLVDGRHLIQGGQPAAVFERALRQIAAQQAPA